MSTNPHDLNNNLSIINNSSNSRTTNRPRRPNPASATMLTHRTLIRIIHLYPTRIMANDRLNRLRNTMKERIALRGANPRRQISITRISRIARRPNHDASERHFSYYCFRKRRLASRNNTIQPSTSHSFVNSIRLINSNL